LFASSTSPVQSAQCVLDHVVLRDSVQQVELRPRGSVLWPPVLFAETRIYFDRLPSHSQRHKAMRDEMVRARRYGPRRHIRRRQEAVHLKLQLSMQGSQAWRSRDRWRQFEVCRKRRRRTDHWIESCDLHFFAVFIASIQDEARTRPLVFRNIRFGIIRDVNHLFRECGRHLRQALAAIGAGPARLRLFFTSRVVPDNNAIGTAHHVDVARHP